MSKTSIVMLSNTQGKLSVVGDKIRADGWYGYTDGLHTVAIYLFNFTGRIWFEASIADDPLSEDWFPILINEDWFPVPRKNQAFLNFPLDPMVHTGVTGDTGTYGMNIIGSYTWLRVRMDRDLPDPSTEAERVALAALLGNVDRVLLNN